MTDGRPIELHLIRRRFPSHRLASPSEATRAAMATSPRPPTGGSVAVLVGSRGIAGIADVVRVVVETLRSWNTDPFVVPAMGSHGGATAAGQRGRLEALGVRPETVGAEIRATMDVVEVGASPTGLPLWADAAAAAADAIVPINRVKPHTTFTGPYGSGLVKMLLVGLGNRHAAEAVHRETLRRPFDEIVRGALPVLLGAVRVPFGVAVVEDANHAIGLVEAVAGTALLDREPALLDVARDWMPSLPVEDVDLLIIDEMSKSISGQGMDPIVTGRKANDSTARVLRLFVRDLAVDAQGSAHGIGQADATTRRLVDAADWQRTWVNTFASGNLDRGRIPPHFETDQEAVTSLLATVGRSAREARIVRILNTLALGTAEVSTACLGSLRRPAETDILAGPYPMRFDDAGNLPPLITAGGG